MFSIRFDDTDSRAKEILTELEQRLGEMTWTSGAAGDRHLSLLVTATEGKRMLHEHLNEIDCGWSNHLTVRPPADC